MDTEPQKKPNIIHITFDSGRADHMGIGGYERGTTPFLDGFAKLGTWFPNAFSAGPGSPLSFSSMFTSTYPLDHGGYGYIDRPRVLIPEALQEAGYFTIGVHSSPYLSGYFGYDRGWNTFRYLNYFKSSGAATPMSPGLRRGTTKAKALRQTAAGQSWLRQHVPFLGFFARVIERIFLTLRKVLKDITGFHRPFFTGEEMNQEILRALDGATTTQPLYLWAHYLDAHAPYGLFYRRGHGLWSALKYHACDIAMFMFSEFPRANIWLVPLYTHIYDESLRYVDRCMGQLFEKLKERGVLQDDSLVVIHADHGEAFMEHGFYGHPQILFNESIKVPLIVRAPGRAVDAVSRPVSLIDVGPTMLSFAGALKPETYRGRNLFDDAERDVIAQASESSGDLSDGRFTGAMVVSRGYKLIRWKNRKFLFALTDAAERKNLYDTEVEVVRDLERRILPFVPKVGYESLVPGWPPKSIS